jgi:hypothetical protein
VNWAFPTTPSITGAHVEQVCFSRFLDEIQQVNGLQNADDSRSPKSRDCSSLSSSVHGQDEMVEYLEHLEHLEHLEILTGVIAYRPGHYTTRPMTGKVIKLSKMLKVIKVLRG